MKLDAATFLLQWATGGLLFGWVTTRRREVSLGYGWLLRSVFGVMAAAARSRCSRRRISRSRAASRSRGAVGVRGRDRGRARRCRSCAGAAGVRGREEVRADAPGARVAAMIGREPTEMPDRERLPGVPARRST